MLVSTMHYQGVLTESPILICFPVTSGLPPVAWEPWNFSLILGLNISGYFE